jgi:hypothetical protein
VTEFANKEWKRVYKATIDGFSYFNFHDKCDNHTNTLTLFKTTKSFIFGGYINQKWSRCGMIHPFFKSSDCFKNDSNAFLISLSNYINIPFKIKLYDSTKTINTKNGPNFSKYVFISEFSNRNFESFISSSYRFGSLFDQNLLTREKYFQTVEIETYTVN